MRVTIDIKDLGATAAVQKLAAAVKPNKEMHRYVAEGALPVVQNRFRELSSSNRNKFGARGGFWNRMLSGTKATSSDQSAMLRMPREVALRYFGGTVTPKKSKYLTIPARGEAYGRSARQFTDLRFVQFRSGAAALVKAEGSRVRFDKKSGSYKKAGADKNAGVVYYWLVRSATIRGDQTVLPEMQEIAAGGVRGLSTYIERRMTA